jgi:flagellar biosynthesis protein FlhB
VSEAKTEEPTTARLRQARLEGDSGASLFASQAVALVTAVAVLPPAVRAVGSRIEERIRDAIRGSAVPHAAAGFDLSGAAKDVLVLSLPLLVAIAVATTAASLVQTGGVLATRRFGGAGAGRRGRSFPSPVALVSRVRVFGVVRALGVAAFAFGVILRALRAHAADLANTSGRLSFAGPAARRIAEAIGWQIAIGGLAIAAVDLVVTRVLWHQRLRMSKDEVQRERRDAEGDPLVKGERTRAREEIALRGVTADAKRAAVVIWDGARVAAALRYETDDIAPTVLVTGEGEEARRLVRRAEEGDVAVREDASLARALADLRAGERIPEDLYDAVADVLRGLV